jgi:3-keto-disaccharide hydrolase
MAGRWQRVLCGSLLGVSLAAATLSAVAAEEESGFVTLTGDDCREHWLGYGLDNAQDTWPANWEFVDGVLHAKGGGADLKTRDQYGDFDLRFEWKISPQGNSGMMYRVSQEADPAYYTGPEYQIVDNVGTEDGANPDTSAASLYALYAPSKDATKPAGQWNEARIVVEGNHVEHYLNGEKVIEYELGSDDWNQRVAASKFAEWKKFGKNRRGYLDLQDHGNEVWYRKMRIKRLDSASPNE